jgi:hypothetical protein
LRNSFFSKARGFAAEAQAVRDKQVFGWMIVTLLSLSQAPGSQAPRAGLPSQVDVEPNRSQVSYSPEDGSAVKVNPPPFIWVPAEGPVTYRLEIAKDRGFRSGVIRKEAIDISTYALDQPLAPGQWYWRYGVEDAAPVFSRARGFIVPEEAQVWYYPGIDKVLEAIPRSHPRLFILKDEVGTYRYRANFGDLAELASRIRKECDLHIGERLIEEPPFTDLEEYNYFEVVPPPIDLMEKFAVAYLLTGERKYGEEAKRRLLHFSSWDPEGSTSDQHNDEPAMWILMRGVRAFDSTFPLFSPEESRLVEQVLKTRARQFYDRLKYRPGREYHSYIYGSHEGRILGFLGQTALCFAHEWDEAKDWLDYVLTVYWNFWPAWGKEDGGWHQGPSYWGLYINFALHFAVELRKATGIDLFEKPFFRNTPYFKLYTNPPYSRMSPFGDGEHHPPIAGRDSTYDKSGEVMYHFSTLLGDPYLRWYAEELGAGPAEYLMGIVLKNDLIRSKPPSDLPQSRYFPGVGLVSLHSALGNGKEDIHFLFHSDPYGNVSHAHPDQNAFTVEAFGEPLAIASGYYPWYGSNHQRNWSWQTKSSNCITVDGGIGQVQEAGATGEVVLFEERESHDYILGDATRAYAGLLSRYQRHVIRIRPDVFVIFDDLEAPSPVTFDWWLHSLSQMQVDQGSGSVLISQGNARLRVDFLEPADLSLTQSGGFPDPPEVNRNPMNVKMGVREEDQWHLTASTPAKSKRARFVVLLSPFRADHPVVIERIRLRGDTLQFDLRGTAYTIRIGPRITVKRGS